MSSNAHAALLAAVAAVGYGDDAVVCDGASWAAVGFAGDGIAGPVTGTATLTFALDGIGSFAFEYKCAAGETLTVAVDGGEAQTLAAGCVDEPGGDPVES